MARVSQRSLVSSQAGIKISCSASPMLSRASIHLAPHGSSLNRCPNDINGSRVLFSLVLAAVLHPNIAVSIKKTLPDWSTDNPVAFAASPNLAAQNIQNNMNPARQACRTEPVNTSSSRRKW